MKPQKIVSNVDNDAKTPSPSVAEKSLRDSFTIAPPTDSKVPNPFHSPSSNDSGSGNEKSK